MANSSGTASFLVNRDAMSKAALRLIRVADPEGGMGATPTMLSNAAEAMNMILKNWQSQGLVLSTYDQIQIPLVIGIKSYRIAPGFSPPDVDSVRPIRLFDGSFVRHTASGVTIDVDVTLLTRQAYMQLPNKDTTGVVSSIYYLPSIDAGSGVTNPGNGWGTLFVYPPSASTSFYTLFANFQRPIYDMSSATDEFDLPQEWFRAIKYAVAADIAYEYGVPADYITALESKAKFLQDQLEKWQYDQALVAFGGERVREEHARDVTTTKG